MNSPKTEMDANEKLHRLCEIDIELTVIEAEMNRRINATKEAAERLSKPLEKERAAAEAAVKAWFKAERKSMGDVKSRVLMWGTLKETTRKSVEILRGWTAESCAEALLGAGALKRFVRRKIELNKAAIHDASDNDLEVLRGFGLELKKGTSVAVEPDVQALIQQRRAREKTA